MVKGLSGGWGTCFHTVLSGGITNALACYKDIIAVGVCDHPIIILNAITGSQIATLSGDTDWVESLAFSPDRTSLVSGNLHGTVELWDVQTGGVVKTFNGHTSGVTSVSISADCTMVASGSQDSTIRFWDIQKGDCCCIIGHQGFVQHV